MSNTLKAIKLGLRTIESWGSKHLPTILTAAATAGVIGSTVVAIKQAPECKKELDKAKEEWEAIPDREKCNVWDYRFKLVRIGAKWYWQLLVLDGLVILCMWEANHVSAKRLAAAIAGGKIFSDKLEALEEQIKADGGEKKLQKFQDNIAQSQVEKTEYDPKGLYGAGEHLCYETIGDHLFIGNIETVRLAVNKIKDNLYEQLVDGGNYAFVSLNDFFLEAGAPTNAEFGDIMGFIVEASSPDLSPKQIRQKIEEAVDIGFGTVVKDGMPALSIIYRSRPQYNYYDF